MTRFIIGSIACLGLACSGLAAPAGKGTPVTPTASGWEKSASVWPDDKLADFLSEGNRAEGVMVQHLIVRQQNSALLLYVRTGEEERGQNLGKRPILAPTVTTGPFARGVRYVARVNRKYGLAIELDLEHVIRSPFSSSGIRRQPIPTLYVYLSPGQDQEIVLPGEDGHFTLEIPGEKYCGQARFQFRSGDERHEITLEFLNRKHPVTVEKKTIE